MTTAIREVREKWMKNQAIQSLKDNEHFQKWKKTMSKAEQKQKMEDFWKEQSLTLKSCSEHINYFLKPDSFSVQPIALRKPQLLIEMEVKGIDDKYCLFNQNEFSVFCVPGVQIPNIMHEIGRLRELTFRQVGEGTNNKIDIDKFDLYYNQLFIWDNTKRKVVGGYRIGLGKEIMADFGRKGFYTQTLFNMNPNVDSLLERSMEMGRSFIVEAYQRKPLSLLLLWRGIFAFLLSKPEYRYLVGPVSISNDFSPLVQQLMVELIKRQHNHFAYSQYISSTNSFKGQYSTEEIQLILKDIKDFQELDAYILKNEKKRMPVLVKKYIQQGAKIACFNVDPDFNNSLDGFLILDIMAIPGEMFKVLSKDLDLSSFSRRIYN